MSLHQTQSQGLIFPHSPQAPPCSTWPQPKTSTLCRQRIFRAKAQIPRPDHHRRFANTTERATGNDRRRRHVFHTFGPHNITNKSLFHHFLCRIDSTCRLVHFSSLLSYHNRSICAIVDQKSLHLLTTAQPYSQPANPRRPANSRLNLNKKKVARRHIGPYTT